MNRRESLKALGITTISTGVLLGACQTDKKEEEIKVADKPADADAGREKFEIERDKNLHSFKYFTEHEMLSITALSDIIIPADDTSGSASDAKVPEFIEFIVKDMPQHQLPLRGGLNWLDQQCLKRYEKAFKDSTPAQQVEMVSEIAYPMKAKPEMKPGVAFFNLMRDLTASGFYTTKIGIKDLGFVGNTPNKWTGVPKDVLEKYGFTEAS